MFAPSTVDHGVIDFSNRYTSPGFTEDRSRQRCCLVNTAGVYQLPLETHLIMMHGTASGFSQTTPRGYTPAVEHSQPY